jgi:hypothetical protein
MPTWGEILTELKQTEEKGVKPPFDTVRRKYLAVTYDKHGCPKIHSGWRG